MDTTTATIRAYPAEDEAHFRSRIQRLAYQLWRDWRDEQHVIIGPVVLDAHGWRCDLVILPRAATMVPVED